MRQKLACVGFGDADYECGGVCQICRSIDQKSIDKLSILSILCAIAAKVSTREFLMMLITNMMEFCNEYGGILQELSID